MSTNPIDRPNRISYQKQNDGSVDIVIPNAAMHEEFKVLLKKAINCAPDISVEMRDFCDRFLERDHYIGACMKQELFGYPKYQKPEPIQGTLDIPSEDKFALKS